MSRKRFLAFDSFGTSKPYADSNMDEVGNRIGFGTLSEHCDRKPGCWRAQNANPFDRSSMDKGATLILFPDYLTPLTPGLPPCLSPCHKLPYSRPLKTQVRFLTWVQCVKPISGVPRRDIAGILLKAA